MAKKPTTKKAASTKKVASTKSARSQGLAEEATVAKKTTVKRTAATKKTARKSAGKAAKSAHSGSRTAPVRTPARKSAAKTAPAREAAATKASARKAAPEQSKRKIATAASKPEPVANDDAKVTTVVAKVDIGYGNDLFIRGSGGGLNWDRGQLMECMPGGDEWVWSATTNDDYVSFKVLVNDFSWNNGEDIVVTKGTKTVVEPAFD